ncbi:MAG TPA: response regulator transcription factor [Acidimicrobiia bacterium]
MPTAGPTIRVLIVDDHALFRRGLDLVLSGEHDIDIVGEAADGIEAVQRAEELLPDVVLMDVRMPRASGIEAAHTIRTAHPETRVIMLTVSDDAQDLFAAVKAGANGYLLKEVSIEEVADAVRAVTLGQSLISPSMASKLLDEFNRMAAGAEERHRQVAPRLTDRELEVVRAAARGATNREIAKELGIAENTVKNHIRNVLEKLHLHSRMEAVMYAVRERLLDLEE